MRRLWIIAVAACMAASAAASAEPVRIARQFGISYLPLILMQDGALLEAEGKARGLDLQPEWITFTGGPPINDALISGSIDLATGGVGPMLTIWGRTRTNLRVKAVAALCAMPIWLNTSNPAVQSIRDFTERDRIALPGVKVSIQAVVLQMAALQAFGPGQQNRLDPLTVSMGHPDAQAALLGGRTEINAHFTSAPFMYDEVRAPGIRRVLDSYEVLSGPHTFNMVWATTRYHDARPEVIAAFVAALDRAMAMIRDRPLEAAAVWVRSERSRLSAEDAAEMIGRSENEWTTTPRRVMAFAEFMHSTGALAALPGSWRDLFFPGAHALDGS
ncbi:MAG: ABC transporter substrate-binding protein [Gemmatimonadaceae bacterium]|nr:ABC transporter substrate-binding protein [Acetobacteraceae bacterium]